MPVVSIYLSRAFVRLPEVEWEKGDEQTAGAVAELPKPPDLRGSPFS